MVICDCLFSRTRKKYKNKITAADEFKPALKRAIELNKPVVIDVAMINNPVPTAGTLEHHGYLFPR
ncbi:hypothetical protein LMF89_22425 [Pelosinus sp. Bkl1]|uniref:Thiamine pyrophosphate enzyme TPP-binding domain-containing protein n=1 Tax=Pelosinus baikalensis TaxID=2892015 RepID=A0ABS8HY46_9FIRM|nr:hypothetical protein [Pelosinus baikalensis]